jgi:hypothetical protein
MLKSRIASCIPGALAVLLLAVGLLASAPLPAQGIKFGTPGDYLTDKMPPVNTLIGGELAWRQHDGGHTNVPNFPAFFEWAGRYISTPGLLKKK